MAASKTFSQRVKARRVKVARWLKSPSGRRFMSCTGPALAVFAVVAVISYDDIRHVAESRAHMAAKHAAILPVGIDAGMMVGAHYITHAAGKVGRWLGVALFMAGFALSLTCNVLAAYPTLFARILGAGVAVLLVLTAAVLHWGGRKDRRKVKRPAPRKAAEPVTAEIPAVAGHRYQVPAYGAV